MERFATIAAHDLQEPLRTILTFTDKLPFNVQYNETDWNFISRMMFENGEWFYYDGQNINLGTAKAKTLNIRPEHVMSLDFAFSAR